MAVSPLPQNAGDECMQTYSQIYYICIFRLCTHHDENNSLIFFFKLINCITNLLDMKKHNVRYLQYLLEVVCNKLSLDKLNTDFSEPGKKKRQKKITTAITPSTSPLTQWQPLTQWWFCITNHLHRDFTATSARTTLLTSMVSV